MNLTDLPHFQLSANSLATWIEDQGTEIWWSVDGDPLLMERLDLPCPGDELASELRKINRPLVLDVEGMADDARGQQVTADDLHKLLEGTELDNDLLSRRYRVLHLSWKGSDVDWLLVEDAKTTESILREFSTQQG